jgi:hypothetical protein
LILVDVVHPVFPLIDLGIIDVIKDLSSVEFGRQNLLVSLELGNSFDAAIKDLLHVCINLASVLCIARDANGPDGREEEHVVNDLNNLAFVHVFVEIFVVKVLQ